MCFSQTHGYEVNYFFFFAECAVPRGRCGASEGAGGLRTDQPGLPHGRHSRPSPGGGQDQGNFIYLLAGCGQTSLAFLTAATHGLHQEADRIKVSCYLLAGCGQTSLAYLTAATHGLHEEADRIKVTLLAGGLRTDQPGLPHGRLSRPPPGGGQDQG